MATRTEGNAEMNTLLAVFATYRLANLIVEERGPFRMFGLLREWITTKAVTKKREPWDSFYGLITCRLCAGVWVAALCAALVTVDHMVGNLFLLIFGLAGAQAFLSRFG